MHYFVFQPPKLLLSPYSSSYRNLSSTRNQFELKEMRRATKGAIHIHGYGTHTLHTLLKKLGEKKLMNGHILEVEDAGAAIWLKLNYDTVVKNGVRYLASYRDIDLNLLEDLEQKASAILEKETPLTRHRHSINNVFNNMETVLRGVEKQAYPYLQDPTIEACSKALELMKADYQAGLSTSSTNMAVMKDLQAQIVDHIKSCGLDSVSRK